MKNWSAYKKLTVVHLLFLFVMGIFAGCYAILGLLDDVSTNIKLLHFNNILMGTALSFLTIYFFRKHTKKSVLVVGWHLNVRDRYFILVIFIITMLILGLFTLYLHQNQTRIIDIQIEKLNRLDYYFLLLLALIGWMMAAVKEEVLSRGYVLFSLSHGNIMWMILLSAFIFMAIHVPTNGFDVFKMSSWFMGGVAYAYVYIKSGSLLVATIIHMIHNFMNDWVLGNNAAFAIVELSQKVPQDDKLMYEIVLKVIIIIIASVFYGKNGLITPASNLIAAWSKNDKD
ncbi:lysostaphin resistance A-like protein [Fredinandcohnia humi]